MAWRDRIDPNQYVRVGTKYYLKAANELIKWEKGTITDDLKNTSFKITDVQCYKRFEMEPNNVSFSDECGPGREFYNLYSKPPVTPSPDGDFNTISAFLRHIFGDQIEAGLDYLKRLWCDPKHIQYILCLVSNERETGKTTFLEFLSWMLGDNYETVDQKMFKSQFTSTISSKILISIDEAKIGSKDVLEPVKNLSTASRILSEAKGVDPVKVSFYGKFVMCSNYVDNFVNIDDGETRYWIRELSPIKSKDGTNFKRKLKMEIPQFLWFLQEREYYHDSEGSRYGMPERIVENEQLARLKANSISKQNASLLEYIADAIVAMEMNDSRCVRAGVYQSSRRDCVYLNTTNLKEGCFTKGSNVNIKEMLLELFGKSDLGESTKRTANDDSGQRLQLRAYEIEKDVVNSHPYIKTGSDVGGI